MNNYKIYIVGKVTGEDITLCQEKFQSFEDKLRAIGAIPINPMKLGIPATATREEALPHCFKAIRNCHAIFLIDDNVKSPGSQEEIKLANQLNLDVYCDCESSFLQIIDVLALRITG